jgi:hypothetical protein
LYADLRPAEWRRLFPFADRALLPDISTLHPRGAADTPPLSGWGIVGWLADINPCKAGFVAGVRAYSAPSAFSFRTDSDPDRRCRASTGRSDQARAVRQ